MQTKNLSREALLKTMANKHSPKKGSADFGTAEHYHFEIEPMTQTKVPLKEHYWQKFEGDRELFDICWLKLISESPELESNPFNYDDLETYRHTHQRLEYFADNSTEKDYDTN